jgi:hypothetical protein
MKLYRALRGDPLLLTLTVLLTLAAWAPLCVSPFLPFSDLHNNAAAASMLFEAATGRGTVGYHYHVNWSPNPYWSGYVFMAAASAVGGVLFAAKAFVAFLALLIPLSVMRLLLALRRSPRLGLWAFALFWEHNLYSGWVTYLLGMALALLVLALLIDMETPRDALVVFAWTVVVALTHTQALALVALAGAGLSLMGRPRGRHLALHVLALSGGLVAVLPWVTRHLAPDGAVTKVPFTFDWHPLVTKAGRLFTYTFDHFPKVPEVWTPAFAFAVLLVGPLVVSTVVRQRRQTTWSGGGCAHRDAATLWVMLSCVLLYALLPYEIRGPVWHYHNYPRYASFALLTLLLLPRPDLRGARALWLAPGVIAALAMDTTVFHQLQRFGENSAPFLDLIHAVPRGSRVLPLINKDTDPACAFDPYNQFHSYLTAATHSYDPYLFDNDANPLLFTAAHRPAVPRWAVATDQLSLAQHGKAFDFILVQGLDRDPFRPGGRLATAGVHRVVEGGIWRLYAIDKPDKANGAAPR